MPRSVAPGSTPAGAETTVGAGAAAGATAATVQAIGGRVGSRGGKGHPRRRLRLMPPRRAPHPATPSGDAVEGGDAEGPVDPRPVETRRPPRPSHRPGSCLLSSGCAGC
jgi:hypothetical protein